MHIDNADDQETQTLLVSLAVFNLTQNVRIPTHNKCHTLGGIITKQKTYHFNQLTQLLEHTFQITGSEYWKPQKLNLKPKLKDRKLERKIKIQYVNFVKILTMTQSCKQQHLKKQSIT